MSKINIDGTEYELDSLSKEAKEQLISMQFIDRKVADLGAQLSVYKTARISYAKRLKELLPTKAEKKKEKKSDA